MATTNTLPDHYTIQFDSNWRMAIQQRIERLRRFSTVHTGCKGKARTHNRISSEEMNEQTQRLQKTVGSELQTVKRWVFPRPHEKTTFLDEWDADLLGETVLPTGDAVRVHRAAAGRRFDKIILDGILGTNYEGGDNDVGSLTAKTRLAVASTFGRDAQGAISNASGGNPAGNLSLEDLIDSKSVLGQNETYGQDQKDEGEVLCIAVNQLAIDSLLLETELTSADYAAVKALVSGEITNFMDMEFVRTEQLPVNDGHSSDGVYAGLWAKTHVHFDIWADFRSRMSIRDDLSEAIQIRSKLMSGACRDEDQAVVWIDLDQTA